MEREVQSVRERESKRDRAEYMYLDLKNNEYIKTNRGLPLIGYRLHICCVYIFARTQVGEILALFSSNLTKTWSL